MLACVCPDARLANLYVALLLSAGADADRQDANGYSALMHAVRMGDSHASVVRRLMSHGANLALEANERLYTALELAMQDKSEAVIAVLMEATTEDELARNLKWAVMLNHMIANGYDIEKREVCIEARQAMAITEVESDESSVMSSVNQ